MKTVLVIDKMPTECIECQFCRVFADNKPTETRCVLTAKRNEDGVNTRAEWCPLKPLPEHKKPQDPDETWEEMHVRIGYNKCLEDITNEP